LASKDLPSEGLVLDRVTVSLKHRALFRLSLAVKPGEIVAVMGPSGRGIILQRPPGGAPSGRRPRLSPHRRRGRLRVDGTLKRSLHSSAIQALAPYVGCDP
ncbi:MAG: hypothetical protein WCB10_01400, partial [Steroidobacteraceae bacterium]